MRPRDTPPLTGHGCRPFPAPITWAFDLLQAHGIAPLAEGEDERRLLGELVSLGWDVSWNQAPPYKVQGRTTWLPVGEVRFVVRGERLPEAALFGLAMALELQKG